MTKQLTSLLFWALLCTAPAFGQASAPESSESKIGLKASYFGEFVLHPGLAAGLEYSLVVKPWFNLHWDAELGAYFHKQNNNALFLQSTIGTRFITAFAAFVDINAGLGYLLAAPSGDVYTVDPDGNLTTKGRPYTSHLKPTISLLLGWDGRRKRSVPLLIHTGIEAYWQSHFNHAMLPHAALRLGVVYWLKK
ncbi:MAG: hypothetical protein KDC44_16545 [Phaeodactylibacter sp.]|nr:hypothetical protein [Phaeodactylibacter sp.]